MLGDDEAQGELAALFRDNRDPHTGELDEILRVHSLGPDGLGGHLAVYGSVMRGTPGLAAVDREMIALVVSLLNACHY